MKHMKSIRLRLMFFMKLSCSMLNRRGPHPRCGCHGGGASLDRGAAEVSTEGEDVLLENVEVGLQPPLLDLLKGHCTIGTCGFDADADLNLLPQRGSLGASCPLASPRGLVAAPASAG